MYNYTSTNQGFTHLYQAHNTFDTFCFLICGVEKLLTCKNPISYSVDSKRT